MKKNGASITCSLCGEIAIFEGRAITDAAYRAARKHIFVDHATPGHEDGAKLKGQLTFHDNGRTTQTRITLYPDKLFTDSVRATGTWSGKRRAPSFGWKPPWRPSRFVRPVVGAKARQALAAFVDTEPECMFTRMMREAKGE